MKIILILNTYQCKKSCRSLSVGKQIWVSTLLKVSISISTKLIIIFFDVVNFYNKSLFFTFGTFFNSKAQLQWLL